jgi:hypothetical protein
VTVDNPILKLTHDHRDLTTLLVAVNEAVGRVDKGESKIEDELHELCDGIEAFREALLDHFAREQEGLLPFVATRVPSMQDRSEQVIADHDPLMAGLTALGKDLAHAEESGSLADWRRGLMRFEELYGLHTRVELAFLQDLAGALASDHAALEELRSLLDLI